MTLVEKLSDVRDFRKILETTVKEIGENYSSEICQIILSNPLDTNFTSICEYIANPEEVQDDLPSSTFPLHLEGGGLGLLSVSRQNVLTREEIDEIRITLANIADLLRYAQINDLVQRDTFRSAFMSEIANLMKMKMGLGDALFMVVNILGKAIDCSRCIFVCVDDSHADWKSYEYYQRERVGMMSAMQFGFPSKDSAIVSQTLLSPVPIVSFEGQPNSYKTPVQEEMEFIGVRSQLSVSIRSSIAVHGAIILQHCDSRHAWTRDEIDMVQSAADTVAEALSQLPEEMKDLEPIMRLHQNEVAETRQEGQQSMQEVRKSLKRTMGINRIATALTSKQAKEEEEKAAIAAQLAAEAAAAAEIEAAAAAELAAAAALAAEAEAAAAQQAAYEAAVAAEAAAAEALAAEASAAAAWLEQEPSTDLSFEPQAEPASGGAVYDFPALEDDTAADLPPWPDAAAYAQEPPAQGYSWGAPDTQEEGAPEAGNADAGYESAWGEAAEEPAASPDLGQSVPETNLANTQELSGLANALESQAMGGEESPKFKGFLGGLLGNQRQASNNLGAWDVETSNEQPPPMAAAPAAAAPPVPAAAAQDNAGGGSKWGDLDSIPTPATAAPPAPVVPPVPAAPAAPPAAGNRWGDLDSIPSPGKQAPKPASKWGDLDAIPSPGAPQGPGSSNRPDPEWAPAESQGGKSGLNALFAGKAKASAVSGQGASAAAAAAGPAATGLGNAFHKGGLKPPAPPSFVDGPPIQIDEAAAEAKLKQILASSNPTSDYIFATPGVDMRLLGRIDGWVTQVEAKDKHNNGHCRAVAEYASAVARLMGMSADEITSIRLAAIIHDVGKLGLPQQILQKPDEQLNDAELIMTMNHTLDGAKLIEGFPELAPLAPIVLAHHEEFDGNGYPEGLSGEGIPLGARIVQACNAYSEMVSDLCYRAGMPPEQAQNEMIRRAGSTYDPTVVQALLAAISQGLVPAKIV